MVYVMEALDQRLVPLMQQIYPGGVADYHRDPFGASLFVSYRVPAAAVAQGRGLIARFYPGASTDGAPTICLLYTSPSPRDRTRSRMPSSA